MKFEVVIKSRTPFHSSAIGKSTISTDGMFNPPGGGIPLIRMRTMPVIADDESSGIRKPVQVPLIPGNTMRNLLRRTMLKNIIEPALSDKAQLSIGAYAAAYAGNASGNPDGVPSPFDETVLMRSHPFIGLFGGGPRMLRGRLMVDNLWPVHVNAQSVLGEGMEDLLIAGRITDVVWVRRVDPIIKIDSKDDAAIIKDGVAEANKWILNVIEQTNENQKKRGKSSADADSDGEKAGRGLNAFNAHEVVIPGVSWYWRLEADKPSEAQVGMILSALGALNKERIAGGNAKGYGEFTIQDIKLNGKSVWRGDSLDPEVISDYMDALTEALDEMTGDEFEAFATSSKGD